MAVKLPTTVLSHWNNLIEELQQSSSDFYEQTNQHLARHQLKGVKTERVNLSEGGVFSANREYLQIRHREFVYHVCAAPYGNGFFVSSWMGEVDSGFWAWLCSIPYLGMLFRLLRFFVKPVTYYRIDTADMFHAVVHGAVTKTLDAILEGKGMRAMTETERKPVMKDVLSRF